MPPFNFRVALDLTAFFEDYRSKCYIYIEVAKIRVIEDLEKHIRDRFGIKDNIFFCTNGYYIPSSESIDILHTNEILKVCQNEVRRESSDSGIFSNIPEGGNNEIKRKKKTKKIQTNPEDILSNGVLSVTCNSSMQFDCEEVLLRNGQNVDGEVSAIQHQEESQSGRKRKKCQKDSIEYEGTLFDVVEKDAKGVEFKEEAVSSYDKDCEEQPKKKQKRNSRQEEEIPVPSSSTVEGIVQQYRKKRKKKDKALSPHADEEGNVTAQPLEEVRECNGNFSGGQLPTEECSVNEDDGLKSRRKRIRRRKKKTKEGNRQPNPPWNSGRQKASSTPKELNSSVNHIRFHSEDEGEKHAAQEVPGTSSSVPSEEQQLEDVKPKVASVSKWDKKPPERRYSCPQENNSGLTLDEVWDKTLPILRYQPTTVIFDCPKTELPDNPKSENVDNEVLPEGDSKVKEDEILMEDGSVESINNYSNMTSSPLEGLPRKNDLIAFKMFRLSEEYTPILSKYITARVLQYDSNTYSVKLQIIKGHEELVQPKGRFSLDDEPEEPKCDFVELNWNEMLDPLLVFP